MVHALEIVHGLLAPGGVLIDIHPTSEAPRLEVRLGEATHLAGWLHETDDAVEYDQADAALEMAVERGLFNLQGQRLFRYTTHSDSLDALRQHLAREWTDAVIDDGTARRIEELLNAPTRDRALLLHETVRLTRLGRRAPGGL